MDMHAIHDIATAILGEFRKYKVASVVLFVSILAGSFVVALNWQESYTSSALIQADRKNITVDLLKKHAAFQQTPPIRIAQQMFYSRLVLTETAQNLGVITPSSPQQEINQAIQKLSSSFFVDPVVNTGSTNLVKVQFNDIDPEFSYKALNILLDAFLENTSKQKQIKSLDAYQFIDAQAQEYKAKLTAAEKRLSEFKSRNTDGSEKHTLGRIDTLQTDLEELAINIDEEKTRIRSIKRKLSAEQEYQKAKIQIAELSQQRKALQASLDQLRLTYKEAYPEITSLRSQIEELNIQITRLQKNVPGGYSGENASEDVALFEELRTRLSTAEVNLESMLQRQRSKKSLLDTEKVRAKRVASNQAELIELTRDYDSIRNLYQDLIEQRETASLSATIDREGQGMTYQVHEHPIIPLAPSGIRAMHFIFIGPILALIIPFGLLVAHIILDPRIRTESGLRTHLPDGLELLGSVPIYKGHGSNALSRPNVTLITTIILALTAYGYVAYVWIMA